MSQFENCRNTQCGQGGPEAARRGSVIIHDGNPQDLVRVVHVHDEIVLAIGLDAVILNVEQEIELALDCSGVCKELRIADRWAAGAHPPAG